MSRPNKRAATGPATDPWAAGVRCSRAPLNISQAEQDRVGRDAHAGEPPAATRRPGHCCCLAAAPPARRPPQSRAHKEPAHQGAHVNNSACACRPGAGPAVTPPAQALLLVGCVRHKNMPPTLARGWACTPSTQAACASQAHAQQVVTAARATSGGAWGHPACQTQSQQVRR